MQPTGDEIRQQLDKVLATEPFANSDRLSRFLRYVVERSLAGEADRLKEYTIGADVFDRGEQYDPRLDSIVRVEAGRLRAKLEEYYSRHGAADPVIVRIPRGSYAPAFERRDVPAPAMSKSGPGRRVVLGIAAMLLLAAIVASRAGRWTTAETRAPAITIVVLPIRTFSTDEKVSLLAARVTDGVTTELARTGTVGVVSHTSALQFGGAGRSLREVAQTLKADVVMEGSLKAEGNAVRVDARLVDGTTDRKFWVEEFTANASQIEDLQRRIAEAVAAAVKRAP